MVYSKIISRDHGNISRIITYRLEDGNPASTVEMVRLNFLLFFLN